MRQQFKQRAHALALFYGPSEQKRDQYETPRNTQKTLQNLPISHYLRAASDSVRDDFLSFCMTFFGDSIEIFLLVYCSCFVLFLLLLLDFYALFFLSVTIFFSLSFFLIVLPFPFQMYNALLTVCSRDGRCRFVYYLFSFGGVNSTRFVLQNIVIFVCRSFSNDSFSSFFISHYHKAHKIPLELQILHSHTKYTHSQMMLKFSFFFNCHTNKISKLRNY